MLRAWPLRGWGRGGFQGVAATTAEAARRQGALAPNSAPGQGDMMDVSIPFGRPQSSNSAGMEADSSVHAGTSPGWATEACHAPDHAPAWDAFMLLPVQSHASMLAELMEAVAGLAYSQALPSQA